MSLPSAPTKGANPNAVLISGVTVVLAMIAAYLYAEPRGINTTPLMAFVSPVVAALLIINRVDRVQQTADQAVRQTNGELTAKVSAILDEKLAHHVGPIVREELRTAQTARDMSKAAMAATPH